MSTGHLSVGQTDGHRPAWLAYGKEELDFQYSPSRSAHAFADTLRRWDEGSAKARSDLASTTRLDVRYGTRPRQTLDWFGIADRDQKKPVHVFIHGGFWQESSKDMAGFLAPSHVAVGAQFVAVGYTLAPDISLRGIIGEIEEAFRFVQENALALGGDPARIIVSGHSAGAFLAAWLVSRMSAQACRPSAAILISGVFDLEPVSRSYVNDKLGLRPPDAAALSFAGKAPGIDIPVQIFVGGDETAEFLRQSRYLLDEWRDKLSAIDLIELPGRDHFDILLDLGADVPFVARTLGLGASDEGVRP